MGGSRPHRLVGLLVVGHDCPTAGGSGWRRERIEMQIITMGGLELNFL
jgi:hypothetical protein